MPFSLLLQQTSETIDGNNFIVGLADNSAWDDVGNPQRSDYSVYLTVDKMDSDSEVVEAITVDSYDPETADTFSFTIEEDAWYRGNYVAIPDYDGAENYVIYDAVYSSGVVYRATASTTGNAPPNNSFWEVISDPTDLIENVGSATESENIYYQLADNIIYPFTKVCYGNLTADANCDCNCDRSEKVLAHETARVFVLQLDAANQRQTYSTGATILTEATSFCEGNNANCGC